MKISNHRVASRDMFSFPSPTLEINTYTDSRKEKKWKRRRKYEEYNFTQLEQFRKSSAEYRLQRVLYQKIANDR